MQVQAISPEELLAALEEVARPLLFPSESDHPLCPFQWAGGGALTPEALIESQGLAADAPVEIESVADLFAPLTDPPPEAGDTALSDAARYRQLVALLGRHLDDLRVYRVGRVEKDVYILGRHPSGVWLGLKTKVVET